MSDSMKTTLSISGITVLLIVGISAILYLAFSTSIVPVKVTGHAWTHSISVEQFMTLRKSGSSRPSDARVLRQWEDVNVYYDHATESIKTDSITMYEYEIDRWVETHKLNTSGVSKKPLPYWADTSSLRFSKGSVRLGDQREGRRWANYKLLLVDESQEELNTYEFDTTMRQWLNIERNQVVIAYINGFGTVKKVDPVEEAQ